VGREALHRDFTLRSAFALAFAFISPIIALYSIFDLGLGIAGPSFWWAFVVVLAGQLLVAVVLSELASRWPEEGGLFRWSLRLVGKTYGLAAGWTYGWTLVTLNVAAAYAASTFAAALFGDESPSQTTRLGFALGALAISTIVNVWGRTLLKVFMIVSVSCEVVGSLIVGTVLLVFHRENSWSVVMSGFSGGGGGYAVGPFLAAVAVVGWALIGFESAADIAEEVTTPERNVPIAQITSLVLVAATVMYAALGLLLAIPNLPAVIAGRSGDPILDTLRTQLGTAVARPLMLVVSISFVAGIAAVSAALSRVVFAMARDNDLPFAATLQATSRRTGTPTNALVATSIASALVLVLAVPAHLYDMLIAMATGGFYIAFLLPVAALLVTRLRGRWQPAAFTLGRTAGLLVNALAVVWLLFQVINISWPRSTGAPWYVEWGCPLMYLLVGGSGAGLVRHLRAARTTTSTLTSAGTAREAVATRTHGGSA
jgi:amino acid transporter